jgi:hypothetical protein
MQSDLAFHFEDAGMLQSEERFHQKYTNTICAPDRPGQVTGRVYTILLPAGSNLLFWRFTIEPMLRTKFEKFVPGESLMLPKGALDIQSDSSCRRSRPVRSRDVDLGGSLGRLAPHDRT